MLDAVELSLFASRLNTVCAEMGAQLRCASFSPNIRDRLDFSCATFDAAGELCAQAAHIPVHLGSMAYAMRDIVGRLDWREGDMLVLNDPYQGGTHLPDVTLIAPVFAGAATPQAFVANRAHHADIGADSPGSMPLSTRLEQEGMLISPALLYRGGVRDDALWGRLTANARNVADSVGDFEAQISANRRGIERLSALIGAAGVAGFAQAVAALNDYAARLADSALQRIPAGDYTFSDWMDDDGQGNLRIPIRLALHCDGRRIVADFAGSAPQVPGNINCPISVTAAAVLYVFRCLMPEQTPACAGAFRGIRVVAPEGCLLNARPPAAVAAGNVETSMRVVDAVLGALQQALPDDIPAASGGSMNNLALGSPAGQRPAWDYYETIGVGAGAAAGVSGLSAVQTHMTNTLNTPVEVLEMKYPLRVSEYAVRRGSGGGGRYRGGDGTVREVQSLRDAVGTVLSERRAAGPWGLAGGEPGLPGRNSLNGRPLPAKATFRLQTGDCLRIETPGGGGFGAVFDTIKHGSA